MPIPAKLSPCTDCIHKEEELKEKKLLIEKLLAEVRELRNSKVELRVRDFKDCLCRNVLPTFHSIAISVSHAWV